MNELEAIQQRHSVRAYTDKSIEGTVLAALLEEIDACNAESGLHIQLAVNEPQAFATGIFKYGFFKNVRNYLCFVGPEGPALDEQVGFYGERVVLKAQQLGLNTCWVALTFNRKKTLYQADPGERLVLVAALGYGATQGKTRKSKPVSAIVDETAGAPDWFLRGVKAALLAPTAMNQQKFRFEYLPSSAGEKPHVRATATESGKWTGVDLGIAKYHFQVAAGSENFIWA